MCSLKRQWVQVLAGFESHLSCVVSVLTLKCILFLVTRLQKYNLVVKSVGSEPDCKGRTLVVRQVTYHSTCDRSQVGFVRPSELQHWSWEKRKVYCRAEQGKQADHVQKTQTP